MPEESSTVLKLMPRKESDEDLKAADSNASERDEWSNSSEYILSLLGYAVGVGNILRFPYLAFKNGGGAFLIVYFIFLFLSGIPLVLLESYVGQKSQRSCVACWDSFVPLLKGVGFSMALVSAIFSLVSQPIVAWIVYYMGASLTWTLPWTTCNQSWNTENCVLTTGIGNASAETVLTEILEVFNGTGELTGLEGFGNFTSKPMSAAEEYWQYNVLQLSSGIDEIGGLNWKLCIAHVIGEAVIFLCLVGGVKSVGKVVYISATLPYLLIFIFVVRAALLPGSLEGIKYYITPDFHALANPELWLLGFLQIFYTLGVGWGALHTMASYNKTNHNFIREAIIVPICTAMCSFAGGFVIFSSAGFLAYKSGTSVSEAMSVGPGVAFVSYPEVTSHLPGGPIWAFLFFFMLYLVVLDTFFCTIETSVSAIVDEFNISKRYNKLVLLIVFFINVFGGLVFFTSGGMYLFQLLDWYSSAIVSFLVAACELIGVTWIYGYQRAFQDIQTMTGVRPNKFVMVPLWGVILPFLLLLAMCWSVSKLQAPNYGDYYYPDWAPILGWLLAVSMTLPIFIHIAVQLMSVSKTHEKLFSALLKPKIRVTKIETFEV